MAPSDRSAVTTSRWPRLCRCAWGDRGVHEGPLPCARRKEGGLHVPPRENYGGDIAGTEVVISLVDCSSHARLVDGTPDSRSRRRSAGRCGPLPYSASPGGSAVRDGRPLRGRRGATSRGPRRLRRRLGRGGHRRFRSRRRRRLQGAGRHRLRDFRGCRGHHLTSSRSAPGARAEHHARAHDQATPPHPHGPDPNSRRRLDRPLPTDRSFSRRREKRCPGAAAAYGDEGRTCRPRTAVYPSSIPVPRKSGTCVPRPLSRARRWTRSARARSSAPRPKGEKTVRVSGFRR